MSVSSLPDWSLTGLLDVVPLRLTGIPGLEFVVSNRKSLTSLASCMNDISTAALMRAGLAVDWAPVEFRGFLLGAASAVGLGLGLQKYTWLSAISTNLHHEKNQT